MEYKIKKVENGYVVTQEHFHEADPEKNTYGTQNIFTCPGDAMEFIIKKFERVAKVDEE